MLARFISTVTVCGVALVALACGSAPVDETAASTQAIVVRCSEPFSLAVIVEGGDLGRQRVTTTCQSFAGPPSRVYDSGAVPSCDVTTVQPAPPNVVGCSVGRHATTAQGFIEAFVCPIEASLPARVINRNASPPTAETWMRLDRVSNGCFSDTADSAHMFVVHELRLATDSDLADGGTFTTPGNCGGPCTHF